MGVHFLRTNARNLLAPSLVLLLVAIPGMGRALGEEIPNPSFSCDKARKLDELAICSDARLAELDRVYVDAFRVNKRRNAKEAIEAGRDRLEARALCGNDRVCILDVMSYGQGFESSPWVQDYRKTLVKEVLNDDLRLKSNSLVGKPSSFALSAKGVQATLIQIDGLDTDHLQRKAW